MRNGWENISLFKFQQVDIINATEGMSDIDKTLFSVCAVFDLTEYQLDNMPPNKAAKLISGVNKIFSSEFKTVPQKKIGKWYLNYDVSTMSFGQYIELSFYLTTDPKLKTMNAHKVMASISNEYGYKNISDEHEAKAAFFLTQPITKIAGSLAEIIKSFAAFNDRYKALFGLDEVVHGEQARVHPFNKRYGWVYAASQVAEYERISLDQAYALPVTTAMHDLTYLKAKGKYEIEQLQMKK